MSNITEETLLESKSLRDKCVSDKNYEVLNKVKGLILLPDNTHITTEIVANYYEVGLEAINSLIKDHRNELNTDGLKVIEGEQLKSFKNICQIQSRARSLTIIPRRAILRIGMLLRDSSIAKEVRTYLLNVEENTDITTKFQSLLQDNNDKLTVIENGNIEVLTRINSLEEQNKYLHTELIDVKQQLNNANKSINEFKNILQLPENESYKYNELIHKFGYKLNIISEMYQFARFNKEIQNWLGVEFPDNLPNVKQYIIQLYGINIVKEFVNGFLIGRIAKNNKDNWIDLSGYNHNNIEFEKTKREFNNSCAYCGKENCYLVPEHIIAQSKDNTSNLIYNIIPSCRDCNKNKYIEDISIWYKQQKFYSEERLNKIREHWAKYFIKTKK